MNIGILPDKFIKRLLAVKSDSILVNDNEAKKLEKEFLKMGEEINNIIEKIKKIEEENNINAKALRDNNNDEIPISEIHIKRRIIKIFEFFNRGRKRQEYEPNIYYKRGFALNSIGKFEEALLYLEKALALRQNNPEILISMSYSYRCLKKYDIAIECCNRALEIEINNTKAWSKKGKLLYELFKFEQAIECFDKALETNPSDIDSWKDKGKCLFKINKFEQAIECFDKTIKSRPDNDRAWYYKGLSYRYLNKHKQAIECFDKCIIINPKDSDSLFERGRLKIINKDKSRGIMDLKNAIEMNNIKYVSMIYSDEHLISFINNTEFKNMIEEINKK